MSLSSVAVRRPVFIVMATAFVLILGVVGYRRLGTDLYPDVTLPNVLVRVAYPGASPEDVESAIVKPLEDAAVGLEGLDRIRGYAREGMGQLSLSFKLGVDLAESADAVRERVAQIRHLLPEESREPVVKRFDVGAAPIITYTVSSAKSLSQARLFAEDVLVPALEQVAGVAAAEVGGGSRPEVEVELDRVKLDAIGLSPNMVATRLRRENLNVPAGHFQAGHREISVRTVAEFTDVEQIRDMIVAPARDGSVIRLRDVAQVTNGFAEARQLARVNGQDAVILDVRKQPGESTVDVVAKVKQRMKTLAAKYPTDIDVTVLIDQAPYIEGQIHQVEEDILFGGLMAIMVILLFMLDVRSTLISAVALPTSVIGTFLVMYALDFSLNMMTLLALSLAIGLLIDDAVVVRENIFKHLEMGKSPTQAALDGTSEVALSVLATTATIVAVFVPIAFVEGIVGQFFRQFGITISAAVVLSAIVAFTLDPMLSSRFSKTHTTGPDRWAWLKAPFEVFHRLYERAYAHVLRWALRNKLAIFALCLGSIVLAIHVARKTGRDFINAEDRGQFVLEVEMPAGTALDETAAATRRVETELLRDPNFQVLSAIIGQGDQVNRVQWRVITSRKSERTKTLEQLKQMARDATAKLEGARVSVNNPPMFEGAATRAPIMINVRGEKYEDIERVARQVDFILRDTPGLEDVQLRHSPGRPELAVHVDRTRAADRGLTAGEVALALRTALEGEEAGNLRLPGVKEEVAIRVRLGDADRGSADALSQVMLATSRGPVKLEDVVTMVHSEGPQVIEREEQNRQITLWATPVGRSLGEVAAEFQPRIAALPLAPSMTIAYDGELRLMDENRQNMGLALLLGVAFIYIVLASQFESFIHPLTIMVTLPLALVGGIVALYLNGNSLAMGSMIGMILMMGLVTKNAILLIDRAIVRVRDHGQTPLQAISEAGPERLRPILMTSTAMVLGMLPTAIGTSEGSEFRAPMAVAVIGGVVSSTVLSLVAVPVLYLAVENWKGGFRRLRARFSGATDHSADGGAPANAE